MVTKSDSCQSRLWEKSEQGKKFLQENVLPERNQVVLKLINNFQLCDNEAPQTGVFKID